MPNIVALLKQEFVRLARRESRAENKATRKASALYRRHIAALRRQVATLEGEIALLKRRTVQAMPVPANSTKKVRFAAKGLSAQRSRLGLSAADYGRLIGVSAQSIYNWELGHATPRTEQIKKVAALRGIGKRDAMARLKQLRAKKRPVT